MQACVTLPRWWRSAANCLARAACAEAVRREGGSPVAKLQVVHRLARGAPRCTWCCRVLGMPRLLYFFRFDSNSRHDSHSFLTLTTCGAAGHNSASCKTGVPLSCRPSCGSVATQIHSTSRCCSFRTSGPDVSFTEKCDLQGHT